MLMQEFIEEITKSIKSSLNPGLMEIKQQIKSFDGKMENMETKLTQKVEDLMEIIKEQEEMIDKQEGRIKRI